MESVRRASVTVRAEFAEVDRLTTLPREERERILGIRGFNGRALGKPAKLSRRRKSISARLASIASGEKDGVVSDV